MKLLESVSVNKALSEISVASESAPRDFSIAVKLAVAENMRLVLPHAQDYEKLRFELIKQFGVESKEVKDQWEVRQDSEGFKDFSAELQKLSDSEISTKFRRIYESELNNCPMTVAQISVLQAAGIIVPNIAPMGS